MSNSFGVPPRIFRGATVVFLTSFFDQNGNVTLPASAVVNITFQLPNGQAGAASLNMQPPGAGDPTRWSASWDSRGASPGMVYYSIHTGTPVPVSVEDGQFLLTANQANLTTF